MSLPSIAAGEAKFKEEYKLTLNVAQNFCWGMGARRFAELFKERTGWKINVKPYYNSTLLKGAQLQSPQMVARSIIDCADIFSFSLFIDILAAFKIDPLWYGVIFVCAPAI